MSTNNNKVKTGIKIDNRTEGSMPKSVRKAQARKIVAWTKKVHDGLNISDLDYAESERGRRCMVRLFLKGVTTDDAVEIIDRVAQPLQVQPKFGRWLRRYRLLRGLTQKDVSEIAILNAYTLEKGEKDPSFSEYMRLCDLFGLSYDTPLRDLELSREPEQERVVAHYHHPVGEGR